MSGIDEMGMESCRACIKRESGITNTLQTQYWSIRNHHGDILGYYNPDEFRAREGRKDKVNPSSGTRERIIDNPDWFVDSIHHFLCECCADRVAEGHPEFKLMKKLVYEFVTGEVFPRLRRRRG